MLRIAARAELEEARAQLRAAAFTGYLFYLTQPLKEGHRHMDLQSFWRKWGLDPQAVHDRSPEALEAERIKGREVGARIAELDRKRRAQ